MANRFKALGGGVLSKVRKSDGKQVFYVRYWFRGKPLTEKVGLQEDAARGLVAARRRLIDEDPAYVPPIVKRREQSASAKKRITFEKFAEEFQTNHGAAKRSGKTFFRPMANRLAREFGAIFLDELTALRLQRFVSGRAAKVGPATVNHDVRFLKNMLNRAVEWGYLKTNPAAPVKQLQEPPARELFLTQGESDKLVRVAQAHVRPVVQFAMLTGMRRGEILALTWPDVNLDRRTIHLRRTKNGRARVLPIGDDLHRLLKGLPRHVKTESVFTYFGRPIKSLQGSWEDSRASLVAAVLETDEARAVVLEGLHFHDLRHTWASRMKMAGVDDRTLMELGGWTDVAMLRRYAHFSPEYKLKAAQLVNGTAGVPASQVIVPVTGKGVQDGQEVSRSEESARSRAS